ncbi:GNAT family N-acetyltransferase [Paenibacillus sambharensis]|uniref:GNAT family N-acetyltransferase n=1 Tax=Paenibacillus sambharensis TaxID=1803190 RepID=A0A2W1M0L5_9BACL|nr:GNAT family N-acetyltransferase [Paenibacillus sambharensis]PZD97257.1 GNAT family N-acetyltransferase [Paenibacillus sambharensis]
MHLEIVRINKGQMDKLLNLYNLYLYDLSQYTGEDPQENGVFDPTNTYLYLEREELHPFFIIYDGKAVGFVLVCSPPYTAPGIDYAVQELFLLKKYRGKNLASQAITKIFDQFKGKISISQLELNTPAVSFWRKYYQEHNLIYSEEQESIVIDGLEGQHTVITQIVDNSRLV